MKKFIKILALTAAISTTLAFTPLSNMHASAAGIIKTATAETTHCDGGTFKDCNVPIDHPAGYTWEAMETQNIYGGQYGDIIVGVHDNPYYTAEKIYISGECDFSGCSWASGVSPLCHKHQAHLCTYYYKICCDVCGAVWETTKTFEHTGAICNANHSCTISGDFYGTGRYDSSILTHQKVLETPCSHGEADPHEVPTGYYIDSAYGYRGTTSNFTVYPVNVTCTQGLSLTSKTFSGQTAQDYALAGHTATLTIEGAPAGVGIKVINNGIETIIPAGTTIYSFTVPSVDSNITLALAKQPQTITANSISTTFNTTNLKITATVSAA